jgi:hypothetical protein
MFTDVAGASSDVGATLTRLCMRHKEVMARVWALTACLLDSTVQPLQARLDDWKKTTAVLDRDHTKGTTAVLDRDHTKGTTAVLDRDHTKGTTCEPAMLHFGSQNFSVYAFYLSMSDELQGMFRLI